MVGITKRNQPGHWFGEKVQLDGYTFDSIKEAKFYETFVKPSGYQFDVHHGFLLHPKITLANDRINLRSSKYTSDFVIYDGQGKIKHVYDLKNSFTSYAIDQAAALRFKMFSIKYGVPVEVVVPRAKSFRVKVMGTTKKFNPVVKDNFDYTVEELVAEAFV